MRVTTGPATRQRGPAADPDDRVLGTLSRRRPSPNRWAHQLDMSLDDRLREIERQVQDLEGQRRIEWRPTPDHLKRIGQSCRA